jgi:DNA-directed RNA polymerase specialized sigma24 family protein
MPARTQTIFALYHFDQRTHAEIVRSLGIAVRTVEDHMARANARILANLERGV